MALFNIFYALTISMTLYNDIQKTIIKFWENNNLR